MMPESRLARNFYLKEVKMNLKNVVKCKTLLLILLLSVLCFDPFKTLKLNNLPIFQVGDCVIIKNWDNVLLKKVIEIGQHTYKIVYLGDNISMCLENNKYCWSFDFTDQNRYEKTSCNGQ